MSNIAARNPFSAKSASYKIFAVLAKAKKPMKPYEVAKAAKVTEKIAQTLCWSYRFPSYHCAPLTRKGVRMCSKDGSFWLESCTAKPNAARPARGKQKIAGKKKAVSKKTARNKTPKPKKTKKSAANRPASTGENAVAPQAEGKETGDWGKVGESEN
jgi:hypothetical protein